MDAMINRSQKIFPGLNINPLPKDEGLAEPLPLLEVRLTLRELDEDDLKELFAVVQGFTDNFDLSCSEMPIEEEDKKANDEYWNCNDVKFLAEPELEILEPRDEVRGRKYWTKP